MKNITFYLSFFLFIFLLSSCNDDEDYKGMNISKDDREVDIKQFLGDLTGHVVIKDAQGVDVTDVDMGQTFYLIDNTDGGVDERTWTITQAGETISSDEQLFRVNLSKPGDAAISLTSTRSSDGKEVTSNVTLPINKIPVTADFITSPMDVSGVISILASESIAFTTELEGSPTMFDWQIVGPETLTSDEQNPTIMFTEVGTYSVTFTASRDDGAEGITEVVVEKTGFIKVEPLVLDVVQAIATDNKLDVEFTFPIIQTIPDEVMSEFVVTINTAAGTTLTPAITRIVATDDNTIQITFADKMYSDDKVFLAYTSAGHFADATGFGTVTEFASEPCMYGHSWLIGGGYDIDDSWRASENAGNNGFWEITSDKSYQGTRCLHMIKDPGTASVSSTTKFRLEPGTNFNIEFDAMKAPGAGGGIELRFATNDWERIGDGIGGNWTGANQFGDGVWKHFKKEKTYTGAGHQDVYVYWLFYGSGEVWIDNLIVYTVNPRP